MKTGLVAAVAILALIFALVLINKNMNDQMMKIIEQPLRHQPKPNKR